jgi:penicillin amidase
MNEDWAWWKTLNGSVPHLLGLDSFGSGVLYASGDKQSILALNGSHGPSWRLVAELGDTVKAQGIFPGGQSGNPGSPRYMNFLNDWVEGVLYPLPLMEKNEVGGGKSIITIKPN